MKTEWDKINIVNTEGKVVRENYLKTAPDQLLLQGTLASGALASISYRMPSSSALDDIGIRWLITGTKGQIEVVAPESQWQFDPPGIMLRVKIGDEETRVVDWKGEADRVEVESVRERVFPGRNTARAWEAFAAVRIGEDMRERYPDFADGVLVHELLERIKGAAGW
jgi:predicted dehydrogenase